MATFVVCQCLRNPRSKAEVSELIVKNAMLILVGFRPPSPRSNSTQYCWIFQWAGSQNLGYDPSFKADMEA
jgi:hypothetical protein